MDDGDQLRRALIEGELTYPQVFDEVAQRVPQLATVELVDIDRVELPEPHRANPAVEWLFRRFLQSAGVPKGLLKKRKRPSPEQLAERREHAVVSNSISAYVDGLAEASEDSLLRSPAGASLAKEYLRQRFGVVLHGSGEVGQLQRQLLAGATSYGEIFGLMVSREPRLDVQSVAELRTAVAALPLVSRRRRPGSEEPSLSDVDDSHLLMMLVGQLTGRLAEVPDELLQSTFALAVGQKVLAHRLHLDPR